MADSTQPDQALIDSVNPSFRFTVQIDNQTWGVFTECTLPTIDWEIQEVKEGGLNTFTHQLPGRRKKATLTLKNGIGSGDLLQWCTETMDEQFTRRDITVVLLNIAHQPLLSWQMTGAYPIKWTAPVLKSDDNAIAIQSLEFACSDVRVEAE